MKKTQLALCFIVDGLLAANQFTRAAEPNHPDQPIVSPPEALSRLKEGIAVLQTDDQALEAFRFANKAMARQRIRSTHSSTCGVGARRLR